jgi:hypothetical protein
MLKIFAIEPKAIENPELSTQLVNFGFDQGRLIGIVPDKWLEEIKSACSHIEQGRCKRVLSLLEELKKRRVIQRIPSFQIQAEWIDTATSVPPEFLQAIIVHDKAGRIDSRLMDVDDFSAPDSNWTVSRSGLPFRNAEEMAENVAWFMRLAFQVKFVDPHFKDTSKHLDFLRECLRIRKDWHYKSKLSIEIHFSIPKGAPGDNASDLIDRGNRRFPHLCKNTIDALRGLIRKGDTLLFCQWSELDESKPRLHDRFVLTEIGGVDFGGGLDTGKPGHDTTAGLLGSETTKRLNLRYDIKSDEFILRNQLAFIAD